MLRREPIYKALVQPLLEYASTAWNPHTNRDTETIEKVQCRAAQFFLIEDALVHKIL